MNQEANLMKMLFDLKSEFASCKKETDAQIKSLKTELKQKDNEIIKLKVQIKEERLMHEKTIKVLKSDLDKANIKIKKLTNELKEKDKIIKKQCKELKACHKEIEALKAENEKFTHQLSKNSRNSSKPSSTNGFKRIYNLKEKSDKNSGGQKGHKGSTLDIKKIEEKYNSQVENIIRKEEILLINNPKLDNKVKYEVDTQVSVIIKKYLLKYDKEGVNLPYNLKNDVSYGLNLKSLVSLLNVEHAIPFKRCTELISELTNNVINLSTGTIANILYELKNKLGAFKDNVKRYLLRQEINHKDETMIYCGTENRWFHVFSNKFATYYYFHKSRGNQADIEKGVLRIFTGTLVHDHMKGLYKFVSDDVECNAHILRYLINATEEYKRKWSKDMIDLLLDIKKEIEETMKKGQNCLRVSQILKYEYQYDEIIASGFKEFKEDSNKYKNYNGEDMKLLRRLNKYKDNHLAFMYDFNIPFDNNLAERDLRMIKAKKKISGCFRSDNGLEAYTDIKSYTSTLRKQNKNIFDNIKAALNGNPFLLSV